MHLLGITFILYLLKLSAGNGFYITVKYLKMTARSKSNSSGAKLGHLVKAQGLTNLRVPFLFQGCRSEINIEKTPTYFAV